MNKRRRRIGRRRRAKIRLVREMREWTKTNFTGLPKRGRLRLPAARLLAYLTGGWENLQRLMAPVLAFGAAQVSRPDPEGGT